MGAEKISLRALVDKWLAPTLASPARVLRTGRMVGNRVRYVCVETRAPDGVRSIFLFRHGDGSWCVFPPTEARPAMCCVSVRVR
ncbi:hypothetical protein C0Z18_11190 [Trinickia dabaoshanensis]|uniref:Uncharacterized protein n=1 Tax=Trinickia dabaoshanensis TaxID=564714 RepID=A0A2N7VTL5_9BURK|nr:hypothetical protein [Trinickia dabaoshanensis]PMS20493.1 hypothetical protein C0Z18_11190 [Trinickia dabaoshanensis]